MRRLILLAALIFTLAACNPQAAPATATPLVAVTDAPLLPVDPTSTTDTAALATETPVTVLPPLSQPTQLPGVSTATVQPTSEVTATPGLQPSTDFDPTPTPETGIGGPLPYATPDAPFVSQAEQADSITPDSWQTVRPAVADQTFSGQDFVGGTLTLQHPAEFPSSGDANGLILSNVLLPDASVASTFTDGQAAIYLTVIPNDLAPLAVAEGFEPSPALILSNFLTSTQTTVTNASWGQILLTTTGDYDSALVSGSNGTDDALIVVINLETGYAVLTMVTDIDQLPTSLPVLAAVAQSLTYTR